MKQGFRQSMAWLHTWTGLLLGWLLFAIFLTGTASYFREEITQWMRPDVRRADIAAADAALAAAARLQALAPGASIWLIEPPDRRDPVIKLFWRPADAPARFRNMRIDPRTGEAINDKRPTYGGDVFYRFHYEIMLRPWGGRWIVGAATMMMLVAIITGIITHRRIFRDFFTFRPAKGGHRAWLDGHNVLAVLALPFHLMITYTGLITFMTLYMPWGIDRAYDGRNQDYAAEALMIPPAPPRAGRAAPLAPLDGILDRVAAHWPDGRIGRITIHHPGDANAAIMVARHEGDQLSRLPDSLVFNGVTGEMTRVIRRDLPALVAYGAAYGLHVARFADTGLRWIFFLSGLLGTAMAATGLVLWVVKRKARQGADSLGQRIVEVLNVWALAGLPLAMAAFFLSNRLLPAEIGARADWEVRIFLGAWAVTGIWAIARPIGRAWSETLGVGGTLFLAIPAVSALTTDRGLVASIAAQDWVFAGFDATMLVAGAFLLFMVGKTARWAAAPRHRPEDEAAS